MKVVNLIKWLPLILTSVGVGIYSLSGGNFLPNFFSFVIGDTYSFFGLLLAIIWLASFVWVVLKGQQIEAVGSDGQSSLYRITSLRDKQLLHVSAKPYNEQSKRIIEKYKPAPAKTQEKGKSEKPEVAKDTQQTTTITEHFSDDGAKKEIGKITNTTDNTSKNKAESKGNKSTNEADRSASPIEKGSLANVNTGIKGTSQFTEEKQKTLRSNLKNFAPKFKEKKSEEVVN